MSIIDQDSITLDAVQTNDDIPMWNAVQQTESPTRAAETGLLVYDNTAEQYKRVADATDPEPYPVTDSALQALIGNLTDAAVTDPAATSAALLGLVRGLLTELVAILAKQSDDPSTATLQSAAISLLQTIYSQQANIYAQTSSISSVLTGNIITLLTNIVNNTINGDDTAAELLASILAKQSGDPATAANQSTANTALASIVTNTAAGATEATAAEILAKQSDDPATATLQSTGNTSLASILAAMPSDPATATNQATANTSLANLDIALTTLRDAILGGSSKTITDVVSALATVVLAAGTAVIGQVGIDQTTPGTTNAVTPVNSSGTEILTETSPGGFKLVDAGIVQPMDKQAIYRNNEVSYTTALAASGTYTSSAIDGATLRRVTGTVYADVAGTLYIQESKDGTTYRNITTLTVAAATPQAFDAIFHSRYIRLYFVNGTTAQTTFELVVYSAAE